MASLKSIVRMMIPPVLLLPFRRNAALSSGKRWFDGDYRSWDEACAVACGYDADVILQTQLSAARKVRDGIAVYERDSVLFDKIEYFFPTLAGLLYVASHKDNRLKVLDFGGALGSSYYQNRHMLSHLKHLEWCIVEQPNFVRCGQAEFENEHLKFFATVDECFAGSPPDVVLLSSVLQYLSDPLALLTDFARRSAPFILVDRTPTLDSGLERIVVQTVPPSIYPASYACRLFASGSLDAALADRYTRVYEFENHIGTTITLEAQVARYRGALYARREI
jgi:putative methyltransferase (TIGR04325 family)